MQTPLSYEGIVLQLRAHHERARGFHDRAVSDTAAAHDILPEALVELSTAMEELRVTEEHLQSQSDIVSGLHEQLERERRHYQQLFEHAPDAYLVTDDIGTVLEANQAAEALLGRHRRLLVGTPLSSYLGSGNRRQFLARLRQLAATVGEVHPWQLILHPRNGEPVHVDARLAAAPAGGRHASAVWWVIRAVPDQQPPATATTEPIDAMVDAVGDDTRLTLDQVVDTAVATFRAQGAGVMLLDDTLALRWVTTSSAQSQALERLQADLGEGPCLEAFIHNTAVSTPDLAADDRWPRLGPELVAHDIRAALCAPVNVRGTPVGTVNVFRAKPFDWAPGDLDAVQSFADLVARLLEFVLDARRQDALVDQLQYALETRVLVEQAKGVLMERQGVDAAGAWRLIRQDAREQRRKVIDLAEDIIATRHPMV